MLRSAPKIMGILNVTPDSFSDGGQFKAVDAALIHALDMVRDGACIIDIGGESTRPGAQDIGAEEELRRVLPVVKALTAALRTEGLFAEISIDTRRPEVAQACTAAGAHYWNDVTGFTYTPQSLDIAADLGCKLIAMHMQGSPETMQAAPHYENVIEEVQAFLSRQTEALLAKNVGRENIWIDPGIGFGKRQEDNLEILRRLDDFHALGFPVLLGASRKSFIGKIDGSESGERLGGSLAAALWGAAMGADILRVHDVAETVQAVKVWGAIGGLWLK